MTVEEYLLEKGVYIVLGCFTAAFFLAVYARRG